jgi:hypothetical protein
VSARKKPRAKQFQKIPLSAYDTLRPANEGYRFTVHSTRQSEFLHCRIKERSRGKLSPQVYPSLHAFFAAFDGRLANLADFYFFFTLFLFIKQFHVASLANGTYAAAFMKQFHDPFSPMRF